MSLSEIIASISKPEIEIKQAQIQIVCLINICLNSHIHI